MEIKHTPGPWKRSHLTIRAESNGVHVAEISPPNRIFRGSEGREEMEYCRGNARLITVAPDLLEALRHAVQWHDQLTLADIDRFKAVIAKATGELA